MNVLLVSPLPPPVGGIASWTEEYIRYFADSNTNVTLIDSSVQGNRVQSDQKRNYIVEIERMLRLRREIKKAQKKYAFDIIHYNASCFTFGLIRDYCVLRACKVPIMYQCHCNLPTNLNNRIAANAFSMICRKVDKVCVLNSESAKEACKYLKSDIATVIPNFISYSGKRRKKHRRSIEKACFLGRATELKGIREFINVARRAPQIKFYIIGPIDNRKLLEETPDNIFTLGQKNHYEAMELLADMDVYILPSYSEGFPLGVLEAMSMGIPIIATKVGAIPDMIEDKGGILVSVRSVDEILIALESIASMEVREDMGRFNMKKVETEYTDDVVMEKIKETYEGIVRGRQR